jgi:glycosyltransferase involved in cell wall biosynthesis
MKKIGLYDPYLDVMGGGERFVLAILQLFERHGYQPVIYWDRDVSAQIKNTLNIQFKNITFKPCIFGAGSNQVNRLKELSTLDTLLCITDGSYFFSPAKHNYIHAMVPDHNLYKQTFLNRLKMSNWKFITHSEFTKTYLKKHGIDSTVIYPSIEEEYVTKPTIEKKKQILGVGRFFPHLHNKNHDKMIEAFLQLKKNKQFADWKLVLAGGLKDEEKDYFEHLKAIIGDSPDIIMYANISHDDLLKLYHESSVYWHLAGLGVDDAQNPELVEHFGITPIEAMTAGCIVFSVAAGGPKEIVQDGKTGFLFTTIEELLQKMEKTMTDEQKTQDVRDSAAKYCAEHFSYEAFDKRATKLFNL